MLNFWHVTLLILDPKEFGKKGNVVMDGTTVQEVRDSFVPITSHIEKRFKSHKCASISFPGGMITQTSEMSPFCCTRYKLDHEFLYPKNDLNVVIFDAFPIFFPFFLGTLAIPRLSSARCNGGKPHRGRAVLQVFEEYQKV